MLPALVLVGCSGRDRTAADPTTTSPSTTPTSTTDTTTTRTAAASSLPLLDAACSGRLGVTDAGTLASDLTSISGLAASRRTPDVVWAIEDSFEPADVVALATDGTELGRVGVDAGPLSNLDWEDLAIADGPDGPQLVVADIGDNLSIRPSVRVLVVDEPAPDAGSVTPTVIEATYRDLDGATVRPNAEALVVQDGVMWVIDKDPDGPATVYRFEPDSDGGSDDGSGAATSGTFVAVSTLDLPGEQVSGADLSADGTVLAVRTPDAVRLYRVDDGADIAEALRGVPCLAPPPEEGQGESIAVLPGDAGLLTVSEAESGGAVTLHLTSVR